MPQPFPRTAAQQAAIDAVEAVTQPFNYMVEFADQLAQSLFDDQEWGNYEEARERAQ